LKRLIASRKLKRTCAHCGNHFVKGNVYYKKREVYPIAWEKGCMAFEYLICPKCKWREEQSKKRYKVFQKHCVHPEKFTRTEWGYIPGECVMEPEYDYCTLCEERF